MEQELTKESAKEIMGLKGEARGTVLKTDMEFILRERGNDGLKQVERELEKAGFPIQYEAINSMTFYPVGMRVLSLLAIKKVLNFSDEEVQKIGVFATKKSLIIRIFMGYFFSVERVFFKEAPKTWKKYYTVGKLLPLEFNEEKKYAVLRVKSIDLHPVFCLYCGGFFCGVGQILTKSEEVTFQERKCVFRGDEYHEYLLKWR